MNEPYKLSPRLDLSASQGLVAHLLSIPKSEPTVLDASDVTHLGALCAQALIAAGIRSTAAGGSLDIINTSDRIETQLDAMGMNLKSIMEGRA
ncbi:MAG: chemotaxis protein CheX [Ascidiaceihabitans sp.]|jgi:chemotaxis protein CheX